MGNTSETKFSSRDKEGNFAVESVPLQEKTKYKAFHHDALHAIVQSKLDSLGVKHVRVTSLENEMMVNAMSRVSEKAFGRGEASDVKLAKEMLHNAILGNFPEAQQDFSKFDAYENEMWKLFMQTGQLSHEILQNEGDSFKEHINAVYEAFDDEENGVYEDGQRTSVEAGFYADPELQAKYGDSITRINKTLDELEMLKIFNGIDN